MTDHEFQSEFRSNDIRKQGSWDESWRNSSLKRWILTKKNAIIFNNYSGKTKVKHKQDQFRGNLIFEYLNLIRLRGQLREAAVGNCGICICWILKRIAAPIRDDNKRNKCQCLCWPIHQVKTVNWTATLWWNYKSPLTTCSPRVSLPFIFEFRKITSFTSSFSN